MNADPTGSGSTSLVWKLESIKYDDFLFFQLFGLVKISVKLLNIVYLELRILHSIVPVLS